jgi:hypothetical protein
MYANACFEMFSRHILKLYYQIAYKLEFLIDTNSSQPYINRTNFAYG